MTQKCATLTELFFFLLWKTLIWRSSVSQRNQKRQCHLWNTFFWRLTMLWASFFDHYLIYLNDSQADQGAVFRYLLHQYSVKLYFCRYFSKSLLGSTNDSPQGNANLGVRETLWNFMHMCSILRSYWLLLSKWDICLVKRYR